MTRIERMYKRLRDNWDHYGISVEKAKLVIESLQQNEGYPEIVKRARAYAHYVDNRTIFIEEDQLLAGYTAAKPFYLEYKPICSAWPDEDFDNILKGGFTIDPEDRKTLRSFDSYWHNTGREFGQLECFYFDEYQERLWDYRRRGFQAPQYQDKSVGISGYAMGDGWGLFYYNGLMSPNFFLHFYTGFEAFVAEAKRRKESLRFTNLEALEKYEYLTATIIAFEAFMRHAKRYSDLAARMSAEESNPQRAKELAEMSKACMGLAKGCKTFREGVQTLAFYWCQFAAGQIPLGRVDQLLYPLYKADIEAGRITREEAKELLQCFRLKVADFCFINGKPDQREKWAGRARWNNMTLGGVDNDGNDATNEITYLLLECSKELHLTQPGINLRIHENTPKELIVKALEVVKEGVGYPAFISDRECIDYLVNTAGIPIREAREFATTGCIDLALPGRSRQPGVPMFVAPAILEVAINGGEDELVGAKCGIKTKKLDDCTSYEEFYNEVFLPQARHLLLMGLETAIVRHGSWRQHSHDAVMSGFYEGALDVCKDVMYREMKYETSPIINMVSMSNVIDSLAAIKKVCFDDKKVSPARLHEALRANWEGYEDVRKLCLEAPKYGNNDDYVDSIGEKLWDDFRAIAREQTGAFGNPICISGVSITSHGPAGKYTGATPDGRRKGEVLADGAASPAQGRDHNGPVAAMLSGMRVGKGWTMLLHNMKFSRSAIKTREDEEKLADLIKTYLVNGGHHIQLNVLDQKDLLDAMEHPENHKDLIVRVAGYSAYFVDLTDAIKKDLIARTTMTEL